MNLASDDALILAVTQEKQSTIYFTTGHGERDFDVYREDIGLSQLGKLLRRDNYKLEKLNLATQKKVPDGCDLLVIAGPIKTFREDEVAALRQYLAGNGKLMVMLQPKLATGGAPSGLEALQTESPDIVDNCVWAADGKERTFKLGVTPGRLPGDCTR